MRTKFKRSRRTIFRNEPKIKMPSYLIGHVIRKPGSNRKGYILDDHIPATDGRRLLIWDKTKGQVLEERYDPKELWVLGYEVVAQLKTEALHKFKQRISKRKVMGSKQKREESKERLLKNALRKVHNKKEGKHEKDKKPCKRKMFRRSR